MCRWPPQSGSRLRLEGGAGGKAGPQDQAPDREGRWELFHPGRSQGSANAPIPGQGGNTEHRTAKEIHREDGGGRNTQRSETVTVRCVLTRTVNTIKG